MKYTVKELKSVIDAINAGPKCNDRTCQDCKQLILLEQDTEISQMFLNNFYAIEIDPIKLIAFAVAMIRIGGSLKEAQMMKEMLK